MRYNLFHAQQSRSLITDYDYEITGDTIIQRASLNAACSGYVIVQPGDTMQSIARRYLGNVSYAPMLEALNDVSGDIAPGQLLRLK